MCKLILMALLPAVAVSAQPQNAASKQAPSKATRSHLDDLLSHQFKVAGTVGVEDHESKGAKVVKVEIPKQAK
jgi:hypothetical protein